jgi:hypothetical protein
VGWDGEARYEGRSLSTSKETQRTRPVSICRATVNLCTAAANRFLPASRSALVETMVVTVPPIAVRNARSKLRPVRELEDPVAGAHCQEYVRRALCPAVVGLAQAPFVLGPVARASVRAASESGGRTGAGCLPEGP